MYSESCIKYTLHGCLGRTCAYFCANIVTDLVLLKKKQDNT